MVAHLAGATASCASIREARRQVIAGGRLVKGTGRPMIDGINDTQIRETGRADPTELLHGAPAHAARAVHRRATYPRLLRRVPSRCDRGLGQPGRADGRDLYAGLVDAPRRSRAATGQPLELTPDHDGRLVADVVRDWADRHGRPFRLELDGPAGGSYARGVGGEEHSLDAVEFCRILSGRGTEPGLLATRVLFEPADGPRHHT